MRNFITRSLATMKIYNMTKAKLESKYMSMHHKLQFTLQIENKILTHRTKSDKNYIRIIVLYHNILRINFIYHHFETVRVSIQSSLQQQYQELNQSLWMYII